jgi:hypothetical protein
MASATYHSLVLFFGALFLFQDSNLENGQDTSGLTMYGYGYCSHYVLMMSLQDGNVGYHHWCGSNILQIIFRSLLVDITNAFGNLDQRCTFLFHKFGLLPLSWFLCSFIFQFLPKTLLQLYFRLSIGLCGKHLSAFHFGCG